jgi:hypothetical protein
LELTVSTELASQVQAAQVKSPSPQHQNRNPVEYEQTIRQLPRIPAMAVATLKNFARHVHLPLVGRGYTGLFRHQRFRSEFNMGSQQ